MKLISDGDIFPFIIVHRIVGGFLFVDGRNDVFLMLGALPLIAFERDFGPVRALVVLAARNGMIVDPAFDIVIILSSIHGSWR